MGNSKPVKLNLGCASLYSPGFVGIDARPTIATALAAAAMSLPITQHVADAVYATSYASISIRTCACRMRYTELPLCYTFLDATYI